MTELRTLGDSGARARAALITLACLIVGFSLARSSSAFGLWALSALLGAFAVAIPVGYSVARAQPIALQAPERIPVVLLGCAMITMTWNGVRFGQLLGLIDVFQLRTGNGQIGQILTHHPAARPQITTGARVRFAARCAAQRCASAANGVRHGCRSPSESRSRAPRWMPVTSRRE